MPLPADWQNPINARPGQTQDAIAAEMLRPSRSDLIGTRLALQLQLIHSGTKRRTPIMVTPKAVIFDGHHAVRAAAETGTPIDVLVVDATLVPQELSILDLPVR